MFQLGRKVDKANLHGHKAVVILGHRFVIRKVNPWIDFREENMPQIFSCFVSRRKGTEQVLPTEKQAKKNLDDLRAMIQAGVVEPKLGPDLSADDLLRDQEVATKLYWEIVFHSLNKFRGLKGVFFSLRLRYWLWTLSHSDTESSLTKLPSSPGVSA